MNWEFFLGFRLLSNRKKGFWLSPVTITALLGVAFGMMALLVSVSIFNGFEEAYQKAILGFNAHLVVVTPDEVQKASEGENFFNHPDIKAWSPFLFREGLGLMPDGVKTVVVKGIDPQRMRAVYPISYESLIGGTNVETALVSDTKGLPPVVVGKYLFESFFPQGPPSLPTLPVIRLLIPKESSSRGKNLKDFAQDFRVVGIFEAGLYEFDSEFVLMDRERMKRLFGLGHEASGFELVLHHPREAYLLGREIEKGLPTGYQIISWDELNEPLFSAMKMEKTLFVVIMFVVILIASFGVVGIILMMVWNRQPEVAILRALGAPSSGLARAFVIQGMLIALGGILLGSMGSLALGTSLKHWEWLRLDPQIYFISHVPMIWPGKLWFLLTGIAFLICYATSRLASGLAIRRSGLIQMFR